ncbi:pyrroline-5-carboxylate reductase [Streptococcus sp. H49]|uniref:pyrroline-5-carboxylate reductase n=1 Tax=Streptococcus huangxiaojuni TaxID=3237239 RepID=UPI0034A5A529
MKIGFIGAGKMASAIINGVKAKSFTVILSERDSKASQTVANRLGVAAAQSHQELIDEADIIVLGLKPQMIETALAHLNINKPLISMAAGVSLERLSQVTQPTLPLIRIMPNLNAQILKSTTAICRNQYVSDQLMATAKTITDSFGTTFELPEQDFDTFTALAGSSPAYIYLFIEALAKAGVKHGLNKKQALEIVTQTVLASSQNLLAGTDSPNDLIDKISSPGGTTITGLLDLEKTGFTASLVSSIDATIAKAKEL